MDELDKILNDVAIEEERLSVEENEDWYCQECEHGPMMESDSHCTRCGAKQKYSQPEELTGWEDEDIEAEVEEIW